MTSSPSTIEPTKLFDYSVQTFLVGDEIALRPVVKEDAPFTASWRGSLYPRSPSNTETWIEKKIGGDAGNPYVIVRKSDGRPVGLYGTEAAFPAVWNHVFIDPLFATQELAWTIEAWRLIVPWQIGEKSTIILRQVVPGDETDLLAALVADGWRESARYRDFLWSRQAATWVDRVVLEYLSPQWVALLGDPAEVPLERTGLGTPRPVPALVATPEKVPPQAIMVGERVYLRPLNKADGVTIAEMTRKEPDPIWAIGRRLAYPVSYAGWTDKLQEKEPQEWVRFAVCLRENDRLIGSMGLYGIDYLHGFAESESEIYDPEYRGGGYGSEAKHLLFAYAFDRLGLHALKSWVIFQNTRSAAALRKQGYVEAGRHHWAYPIDGGFGNAVVFTLHADTWRALPRTSAE
ncbi:MAG TPA: GNAT family protein [Thermomicrobiales bacterium]|nr:GNAT family protein [Thermomicrobiales bacterium]